VYSNIITTAFVLLCQASSNNRESPG